MSRTDKHRPAWVQIEDHSNRRFAREHHDHTKGPCDIDKWSRRLVRGWFWDRSFNLRCWRDVSYYGFHNGIFPRPRKGSWDRSGRHGHIRILWRKQRQQLLKGEIEDGDKPTSKWYKRDMWNEWSRY